MPLRYLLISIHCSLLLSAAALADERVDAAIKALAALGANSEQLQQYCAIVPEGPEVDAIKAEQISIELEKFFKSLGPDYEAVWQLGDELADDSKEVAALEAAFDQLERNCKRD